MSIPARCGGTDTAGRGALEPLPEDGARTKLFDRESQFRESHTEAQTKKTPDRIPEKKNNRIFFYIFMYIEITVLSLIWEIFSAIISFFNGDLRRQK